MHLVGGKYFESNKTTPSYKSSISSNDSVSNDKDNDRNTIFPQCLKEIETTNQVVMGFR